MSRTTLTFDSAAFGKAKQIVERDYKRITVKSSGKVSVQKSGTSKSPTIIIKSAR